MEVITPTKRRMVERGLSWPRHEEFWLAFIKKNAKGLQSSSFDRLQLKNRNPLIAPRRKVYPSDPTICGFTLAERGLSLTMDSMKAINELRHELSASTLPQEILPKTELSLRSMKLNKLKEDEQSSVCIAAGRLRGGIPQSSKLAKLARPDKEGLG
ncbi:LOW QUALITY PROTEIN: hypothetical protein YC2023_034157 [Brassica napus]